MISGGGGLEINDNVLIGQNVIIHTANHIFDNRNIPITAQGHHLKSVKIEANSWVGAGAIILPGVTIAERCIIGAGSVVTKSTEKDAVYAGNPAVMIKSLI